jgi:RimJ/RimL family protein N-acetyltransferase
MDVRIEKWIENAAGLSITEFPDEGVRVSISQARNDKPRNRLLVQRVIGKNGVLVTGIPRIIAAVKECTEAMTNWELFSPFGLAEIRRALPSEDAKHLDEIYGLDYFLTEREQFCPAKTRHNVNPLKKKDIPLGDENLRLGERRSTETDDFTWAFTCYHNDPNIPAILLPDYGPHCASVAVIFWRNNDIAGLGVGTEDALRGRGYATDVVCAGTQFILDQGGIAWYGAYANNVPSLRIPRRLGFSLVHSSFCA